MTSECNIAAKTRLAYALLALPIAVAGLPIYLQMPQFYAEMTGLSLASLGIILLLVRVIDTVQDPIIGLLTDRANVRGMPRARQMRLALPFFLMGFVALVMPTPEIASAWLAVSLVLLYTSFSIMSVNYYAIGASLAEGAKAQNNLSSWREAVVLLGILIGSVVPQLLVNSYGKAYGYMLFAVGLGMVCVVLMPRLLKHIGNVLPEQPKEDTPVPSPWSAIREGWEESRLRALFSAYLVNGMANAFPATLILFYVSDVLGAADQAGYLLGVYFAAGIFGMPLWAWLANKYSADFAWRVSILFAAIVFMPSAFLGQGDVAYFYIICALSGLCLGADMAMPASLLSQALSSRPKDAGGFFGVYNLLFKLALALAAGIGLPLLDGLGYTPGAEVNEGIVWLALLYGGVPAGMKLLAAYVVWRHRSALQ